jgi:hypothetical protein
MWIKTEHGTLVNMDKVANIYIGWGGSEQREELIAVSDMDKKTRLCSCQNGELADAKMEEIAEAIKNGDNFFDLSK